jgi:malonate-semialdehyde dehydrogenase (acetylating) / methylmalonate-semialdehyde dehydrogenase
MIPLVTNFYWTKSARFHHLCRFSPHLHINHVKALHPRPQRSDSMLRAMSVTTTESSTVVDNWIGGKWTPPSTSSYMPVTNPATNAILGSVAISNSLDVAAAVMTAKSAQQMWVQQTTMKARAAIMLRFHHLIQQHADEIANLIVTENGKNITEALADVAKGLETVEYACGIPNLVAGKRMKVSSDVYCEDRRDALGVVVCVVPFNFPFMVPMWTIPIALMMGNAVILKPSEKVPLTMHRVATILQKAGLPDGVFNMIQGTRDAVNGLLQHPDVQAVTFVGSSPIAKLVSTTCHEHNKRCTALGGAKNHLVALPDCDIASTASDVVVSFAGCAGQRCMAASVLLLVNDQPELLKEIIDMAQAIQPGTSAKQMGPVIDISAYNKVISYIKAAEEDGAKILLDGRDWGDTCKPLLGEGNWIGPTILLHHSSHDKTMCEEVFGPVLSVYVCQSWEEAIQIENTSPFGNAASIYTTNGGNADWFTSRFRCAMLGVNIGIPVPREPFSFGGLYGTQSKYGQMDVTGDAAIEFFTNRIKVTSRWPVVKGKRSAGQAELPEAMSNPESNGKTIDHANFAGSM